MRRTWLLSLLSALALVFAGCSDNGDDDCTQDNPEACPGGTFTGSPTTTGTQTSTNTTPPAPNLRPVLEVSVTDDGGNATQIVLAGGNLTFSIAGSTDPDGMVENAAITVFDANRTNGETKPLMRNGQFVAATYSFPTPGVARAFISMVDDRSGFNSTEIPVYVNHVQMLAGFGFNAMAPPTDAATKCAGPADPLVNAQMWRAFTFATQDNATWVEATATISDPGTGTADIAMAICTPSVDGAAGTPLSDEGDTYVATNVDHDFEESLAYFVSVMSRAPATDIDSIEVVVHYEPREASGDEEAEE